MSEEQKVMETAGEVMEQASEAAENAAEKVEEVAETAAGTVEAAADAAEEKAEEATKAFGEKAEEAGEAAQATWENTEEVKEAVKEAVGKAAEALSAVGDALKEPAGKVLEAVSGIAANLQEALKETVANVKETVTKAADEAKAQAEEKKESMEDFKDELEASYRKIHKGDIVTGTVINVGDTDVTIDFNYYAPGRIPAEEMSNDPSFSLGESVQVGDTISALVLKTDDGSGNMLLSAKAAASELAWDKLKEAMDEKKVYHGKVSGIVKGGAVMYVEGVRGFIPASRLALNYVEDLNVFLNQEMDVQVIEVSKADRKVILSAKEQLRRKAMEEKNKKMQKYTVGTVLEGKVESLKDYGAFIDLGDGVSGLLHVSQISDKRIAKPSQVLKVGDTVKVKITKVADNKISLSMREAAENTAREVQDEGPREYSDGGSISTGLGDLLKNLKIGQ